MRLIPVCIALMCAQDSWGQTPTEFYKKMTEIMVSMNKKCDLWANKLGVLVEGSKKFVDLKPYRIEIQKYVDQQAAELKKVKDVDDSKEYREAVINYFEYEKTLITNGFIPIEQIKPHATDAQIDKAMARFTTAATKEERYLKNIKAAQDEYTRKNGIMMDTTGRKK
jgi:hypothetical protein